MLASLGRLIAAAFLAAAVLAAAVATTAGAACRGDCNGSGSVTVDEVVLAVNVALGAATLDACAAADVDGDRAVTVDEIIAALDDALDGCRSTATPTPLSFESFPFADELPDPRTHRLCVEADDPDAAADTTFIDCAIEGASFIPAPAPPKDEITVVAYNILRGFEVDAQLAAIAAGDIPTPDVLLLSEADRGCRRTDFRNVARDYAEALGLSFVFATEFVELPSRRGPTGPYDPPLCEHGNAILARYPLGNVRAIRHAANRSWYTPPDFPDPDEPRLGGRIAVAADMLVGDRVVRLYSLHFESTLSTLRIRDAQAVEIAADGADLGYPVVAGGDLNAFFARLDFQNGSANDGATQAFFTRGYRDAHVGLPLAERDTIFDPVPLVIDFLFVRNADVLEAGLCPREHCGALSDHLPVWAVLDLGD